MTAAQKIEAAEAASLATPGGALPSPTMPDRAMPSHDASRYHKKLERVLDRMGSLYTVDDLLTRIFEGKMQSFCCRNSWMITQVVDFPRARQLQVVALVGDLADIDALHAKLLAYADEANVGLLSAYGRSGWIPEAFAHGWRLKARSFLYHKEL